MILQHPLFDGILLGSGGMWTYSAITYAMPKYEGKNFLLHWLQNFLYFTASHISKVKPGTPP